MPTMTSRELADEYWYCLKDHRVEKLEDTDSSDRIGPFKTYEEAAHALNTIQERNEKYDREDAEWNDD